MKIQLTPIKPNQIDNYVAVAHVFYVKQLMNTGWSEIAAWSTAKGEMNKDARGAHILSIGSDTIEYGMVWIQTLGEANFILWIRVNLEWRRQGVATAALKEILELDKEHGRRTLLHVFEHNSAARRLYEKVGFVTTGRLMARNV